MERGRFEPSGAAARMVALATVALLVLVAWAGAPRAAAAVGLDPSFGKGGLAVTSDSDSYEGVELGIAPDGSSLVTSISGGSAVRFSADGSLDPGFGGGAGVLFESVAGAMVGEEEHFQASATALDDQGRTLIFGELVDSSRSYPEGYAGSVYASSAAVIRLGADGRLDPTFGDGNGYVVSTFGIPSQALGVSFPTVGIMAGTVDSHGRPVLIAGVQAGVSGCYAHSGIGLKPVAIVRLTESGAPDPTFGGGEGVAPIGGSGSVSHPLLGLDAHGRPVASVARMGSYKGECGIGRFVYRLGGDGSRLGSFGDHGFRHFTRLKLDFIEPSGALILSRRHGSTLGIIRLRPDGDRDMTFGHDGVADLHLSSAVSQEFAPVAVDGRGRILLAGIGSTTPRDPFGLTGDQIVLGRLLADGEPDASFGHDGLFRALVQGRLNLTDLRANLDPQGRLLVGATITRIGGGPRGFLLARYLLC
jgi:uncharacterized delta-60 repeat protein